MDKMMFLSTTRTKAMDAGLGIYEALISTESEDRQGDVIRAAGAQISRYMANPVVLWAHQYDEAPVARALSVEVMPGVGLRAVFQFPEWGVSEDADQIHRLWDAGFLNATSIGFMPLEGKPGPAGIEYTAWELLEFSIVPVPANAEALRLAVKAMRPKIKRGRVLSAANEERVRQAVELLTDVLTELEGEARPDNEPDPAEDDPAKLATEKAVDDEDAAINNILDTINNLLEDLK